LQRYKAEQKYSPEQTGNLVGLGLKTSSIGEVLEMGEVLWMMTASRQSKLALNICDSATTNRDL